MVALCSTVRIRDVWATDDEGWTALMHAAWEGNIESLVYLLHHGARVDVKDPSGNTALMLAAMRGHRKTIEILLQRCPRTTLKNVDRKTARMLAAENGHDEIAELLKKRELFERGTPLPILSLPAFLLFLLFATYTLWANWPARYAVDLCASATFSQDEDNMRYVILRNQDSFDWKNVTITVETDWNGCFDHRRPCVQHGAECVIEYAKFTRDNSTQLHPFGHKPWAVYIEADTAKGKGHWYSIIAAQRICETPANR